MIPSLANNELFQSINDPNDLQRHLICIENFICEYIIYNSNKKSKFYNDFERNNNEKKLKYLNLEKEKEKEELEKKINEINEQNILLLKEIQGKKKLKKRKSNNSIRGKNVNHRNNLKTKLK